MVFAVGIRLWALRVVGKDRVHPLMHSAIGWPLIMAAWVIGWTWFIIALTVGVLTSPR